MTEREYKIVCKLIDLHTCIVVRGDGFEKRTASLLNEYKEIGGKHIEELKKDICDLLVNSEKIEGKIANKSKKINRGR